jgi:hypothetical protein
MGRECSTYGGHVHTGFWWGNLKEGDYLKDPDTDGRMILNWVFQQCDGRAWTGLRERWQAVSQQTKYTVGLCGENISMLFIIQTFNKATEYTV